MIGTPKPQAKDVSTMKKIPLLVSAVLVSGSAMAMDVNQEDVMQARQTIKSFGGQLKGELQAAMKAGGPVNAISVCHTKAPEIAAAINQDSAYQISRTSQKNRNDGNAPSDWQQAVLEKFEARKAAGEDVAKIDHAEVVDGEFRYMKAIPTGAVCLNCHGSDIRPEVSARLDELYPNDKARGYSLGDIRGAFYVTKKQ
jgi:hypothetical protein